MTKPLVLCAAAVTALLATAPVSQAAKIGVASVVKNDVHRVVAGGAQPLSLGSDVFTNERIGTGDASSAQLLFLDKTSLTIGPHAELSLDRFVYDPSNRGAGRVVLSAVRGAFRFITGSQDPRNYTINTPIGSIGVRGTIGDIIVNGPPLNVARGPVSVTVILVEGKLIITFRGLTYVLDRRGTAYTFNSNGTAHGPQTYDGSIISTGAEVTFPLYGWYFPGEAINNGLPLTTNNIDNLNAVIQHSIRPPSPPPPPPSTDANTLR